MNNDQESHDNANSSSKASILLVNEKLFIDEALVEEELGVLRRGAEHTLMYVSTTDESNDKANSSSKASIY